MNILVIVKLITSSFFAERTSTQRSIVEPVVSQRHQISKSNVDIRLRSIIATSDLQMVFSGKNRPESNTTPKATPQYFCSREQKEQPPARMINFYAQPARKLSK